MIYVVIFLYGFFFKIFLIVICIMCVYWIVQFFVIEGDYIYLREGVYVKVLVIIVVVKVVVVVVVVSFVGLDCFFVVVVILVV